MDEKENTKELIVVDVKHYKKVKKALHESEERYRQLFENVPIGIYRTTLDGRILDANSTLVTMLGFATFAEMAPKSVEKDFWAASYSRKAFITQIERDGEIKGLESLWVKKDGTPIHVRENAKLIRAEDGQIFFEGTVEDITLSKLAEAAQKTRTKQLETLNLLICSGNQADSLPELLDTILNQVIQQLGFDMAAIYLLENDSKQIIIKAQKGASKGFLRQAGSLSTTDHPFAQVLSSGQSLFSDNLHKVQPQLAKKMNWHAAACVPLVCKGLIIGTLNVASCQRSFLSETDREILNLIGKEAGTLISKLQTEMALRESEKYYRALIDTSPDVIAVTDLVGNIQMVNQRFVSMSGYCFDEIIGKKSFDFVAETDLAQFVKRIKKFIKSKKLTNVEYNFKKKNGDVIPMELSASLLLDNNGKARGLIGFGRDISDHKRDEQQLRESKALIDAVVENVPLMVFLKEASDLRFVIFNRAGEELLGYDRKSLLGKNNLDLFPAEQAAFFMAKDREALAGEADLIDISEEPIMTAKKGQRILHTRKVCIRGADGITKYLLGISEDITERKEAESKLLAYQEQLRSLTSEITLIEEKERRRIANELHDQIGQNLALCKLKVAALENDLDDEGMKGELAAIRRLLECSIQDARSLIFDLSPPILYELGFSAALEWLAERIQEQFHIPVECESSFRDQELEDDQQVILFQVVRELLINMGKHSRASQAKIIVSLEGSSLKIQVNDDGIGFDAALAGAPRVQQNGFGFFSARERLNYLNGTLEVKSKPGHGSQIILTVPLQGSRAALKQEK